MIHAVTSSTIAIVIMTMNLDQQNALALNTPLPTGKMTVVTINQKKAGYKKPRSNGKVPCPIYSFPDNLAIHTWVECSRNPANQKKLALQSAVDAHHTTNANCYLSDDNRSAMDSNCTEAADNKRSINRRLFSNFNDNFVTFLAPPLSACKKVAENVKPSKKPAKKKRKTFAASSSDRNEKDMAYAQSTLAFAKGLKEPLAFFSNTE
jgi:hypothetical protein